MTYQYYLTPPPAQAGKHVVPGSLPLGGSPVDAATEYRVTMNSFLASGGDNFTVRSRCPGSRSRFRET